MAAQGGAGAEDPTAPFLGALISLTSRSNIRYQGVLADIDPAQATLSLESVRSHGTEGRCTAEGRPGDEVAGTENVFDYIVFRAADVLDLKIDDPSPKKEHAPPTPAAQSTKQEPPMPQTSNKQHGAGPGPIPQGPYPGSVYGMPMPGQPPVGPFGAPGMFMAPGPGFPMGPMPPGMPGMPGMPGYPIPGHPMQPPGPQMQPAPRDESRSAQPSQPAQPAQPAQPQQPSKPAQPSHAQPVQPATASQAVQGKGAQAKPAQPAEQGRPAKGRAPGAPAPAAAGGLESRMENLSVQEKAAAPAGPQRPAQRVVPGAAPGQRAPGGAAVPSGDYDFESANARFQKDRATAPDATAQQPAKLEAIPDAPAASFYDKKSGFFDDISSEVKDRFRGAPGERGGRSFMDDERAKNAQTFGDNAAEQMSHGRRGGNRRNRGRRGGRRGGRPAWAES